MEVCYSRLLQIPQIVERRQESYRTSFLITDVCYRHQTQIAGTYV